MTHTRVPLIIAQVMKPFCWGPATMKILSMIMAAMAMSMLLLFATTADAFQGVVGACRIGSQREHALAMMLDHPPSPPAVVVLEPTASIRMASASRTVAVAAEQYFQQHLLQPATLSVGTMDQSPSTLLSIQEYRKPTAEELAQKKLNFNLIFWGGGFVAPFLATIFYFGFQFWKK